MSRVVRFPATTAEQRFRHELNTAISILCRHAKEPMSDGLLEAIESLGDDLIKMVNVYRSEGQL
jgi:hypothetical protein